MIAKKTPNLDQLRAALDFDAENGQIKHKNRKKQPSPNNNGYVCIGFNGAQHRAHRLIWSLYHNRQILPHEQIDHINGNRSDNRIENLRLVTPAENARNTVAQRSPKNQHAGVTWDAHRKKWQAHIQINRKKIRIGRFDSIEDAIRARKDYEEQIGFNNIGASNGNGI